MVQELPALLVARRQLVARHVQRLWAEHADDSLLLCILMLLFSSDNINCNKHKMERFLHHGRDGEQSAIAAVGSLKSMDPNRIILKKIVLTMYPQSLESEIDRVVYVPRSQRRKMVQAY
uniref:Uncharacterized protein n=1 Tax=Zea mays TaxID=4577 RepID=A0A804LY02_MAIZE